MIGFQEWVAVSKKPGPYRVTRWCCSGNCIKCRAAFDASRRVRVVQMSGLNKKAAQVVLAGWSDPHFEARIEKS